MNKRGITELEQLIQAQYDNIAGIVVVCLAIGKCNFWQSKVQLPAPPYLLN